MAVKPASVNESTGIIRWEHGSAEQDEVLVLRPLSPFLLRQIAEADKAAEQERKGFHCVEDLAAAKANRDRQTISVYPNTMEETDKSKEARRLLRQLERENGKAVVKERREFQPVVNLETGRVKWS